MSAAGLNILEQEDYFDRQSVFFKIGSPANNTDFWVSRRFLSDFQHSKDYVQSTNEYIAAVAAKYKCDSPEHFYCLSGPAIQVSVRWPIQSGIHENQLKSLILLTTTDLETRNDSKNSIEGGFSVGGRTFFDIVAAAVNTIRAAIDAGELDFVDPNTYREVWKRVERRQIRPRSHAETEDFLCGKAFMLGFMVAPAPPSEVWAVDPNSAS